MGFILWIHPEISPNMMKHTEPCPKKSPMPPKCITPSTSYHSHLSYPHCGAVPGRSFCNREVLGVALFSAFMACKNHWASPLVQPTKSSKTHPKPHTSIASGLRPVNADLGASGFATQKIENLNKISPETSDWNFLVQKFERSVGDVSKICWISATECF